MKLTIQQKLFLMAGAVVVALALILTQNLVSSAQISRLHTMHGNIKDLQLAMLQLRRNEKDFLMRRDLNYRDKFSANHKKALIIAERLIATMATEAIASTEMKAIKSYLIDYQEIFNSLVAKWQKKGLDKDAGHYGRLREATHNMEAELKKLGDLSAHVQLLTLRRHEKDFILRDDPKYGTKLRQVAEQLAGQVSGQAADYLQAYRQEFDDFVAISKEIGFNSKSGLRGAMRASVHKVESALDKELVELTAYIDAHLATTTRLNIAILVVISMVLLVTVLVIAKQIIRPLKHIANELTSIQKSNDLSRRVQESDDEIGVVAKNFNILMEHFQSLIRNIDQAVDSLTLATQTVSSSVSKTSTGLLVQSQESDMVATAISELGASALEIANNAQLTTERTEQATTNARDGNQKLDQTINNVNELSEQLVLAGDEMLNLQEKSNGISAVLDVIKGIAEQTNLLALNAAIEAARAGEQGRGFAVVADEVRTLAVRTQESTSEITAIIEELQSSTTSIAHTVTACKESGVESADMATEAGQVLNLIVEDMNAISQMTAEIATAVTQQSVVVQDVDQNIVRIRDVGEQVASDSKENAEASEQVAQLAKVLHEEAIIFKV